MIVIPMAGMSSRFFKAGYDKPKYMLRAHDKTLFEHSVNSFKNYYAKEEFLFIVRDIFETVEFVKERAKYLGIKKFRIAKLNLETKGQAETVYLGLKSVDYQGPITIFNIDTFRPDFIYPNLNELDDGYLEVFKGTGENWSFVKSSNTESTQILETAEKRPISDLCCTGLYYFSDVRDYMNAYKHYLTKPATEWECGELYVAPLYNYLIENGKKIHYKLIKKNEVIFCGVPEEYLEFKNGGY
ncbi:glycosyltransferase family 2 protein [Vibrio cyclitrophicus]|uniref:glycosyltransferase family 2 protein n=1 Tax=Vibrio cyclitrophicus TaxID=47951 RepID=UPI0039905B4E